MPIATDILPSFKRVKQQKKRKLTLSLLLNIIIKLSDFQIADGDSSTAKLNVFHFLSNTLH